jgi:predicted RNA methylase
LYWYDYEAGYDTVLQNPPFGVQMRAADRRFLEKALEVSQTIYSLHKHPRVDRQLIKMLKADTGSLLQVSPSPFIEKFVEELGGIVEAVYAVLMTIPRMFDFHTKARHDFVIDLYLIKETINLMQGTLITYSVEFGWAYQKVY